VTEVEVGLEALHLAPERVPLCSEVAQAEVIAVEHDHPGAGAEDRLLEAPQRVVEAVEPHQPRDRRRLSARDDQAVEAFQLLRQPHLDRLRAQAPEHERMLAKVPLHGKHADPKRPVHGADCTGG
jgi:hypothetical protein